MNKLVHGSGPFRKNEYVRPEDKEPKMIAKYRRMMSKTDSITFEYKLVGQWAWHKMSLTRPADDTETYTDVERRVKQWLEFHARTGTV